MKENLSIYVHIPFCESKCFYCDFVSFKKTNEEKEFYVKNLINEIELNKTDNFLVKTIFIGGGTPSCLDENQIAKILDALKNNFCIDKDCEITIEVNPNSFTEEKAEVYKKIGINRISVGLQSSNNKLLKKINRIHTKKDFIESVKLAKKFGIFNINADILLGLPNQTILDVKNTLRLLVKLDIPHISAYSLILEENTVLFNKVKNGEMKLPKEEKTIKMYDFCLKYLKKHGINRYEVSNFCKSGYECKHNLVYWNDENYLGLGLNSASKIRDERFENFADFNSYYDAIKLNEKPIKNKYKLSLSEKKEEFIMLGLRKESGIDLKKYNKNYGEDLLKIKKNEIDFLKNNGFIEISQNNLKATPLGFKVLNQIILNLV